MDLTPTVIGLSIFAIVGTIILPIVGVGISIWRMGTPPDAQDGGEA